MTPSTLPSLPSFTVVIEWENAKLSEFDRARRMLEVLAEQIGELRAQLPGPPEVILLHDRVAIDGKQVQEEVARHFGDPDLATVRLVETQNQNYFQQKNIGAAEARTDVVVFVDSDVIPQPEWLETLLTTIADPDVEVVAGETFMGTDTFLARAFSLFWLFPPERKTRALRKANHFFVNNVAFRRSLITSMPFPDLPTQRGQSTILGQDLLAAGHEIYIHEGARVDHPPPNGLMHLVYRAVAQGRDDYLIANEREPHKFESRLANCMWRYRKRVFRAAKGIVKRRRSVGFGLAGTVAATGVALLYYTAYLAGVAITLVDRDFVAQRFPI